MTPAARLSAAIELIQTIDTQRVPAAQALKEWGTAHRYAGSGDRAGISGLVWDVLRRRSSSAWLMEGDTPRARVLGMLRLERGMNADAIAALCDGGRFAPEPLSDAERAALTSRSLEDAPTHVAGDYPEWLDGYLADVFGDDRVAEATAMASRAPARSARQHAEGQTRKGVGVAGAPSRHTHAVVADRLAHRARRRRPQPRHSCRGGFIKGAIEVQDEGSQLAALLSAAKPGEQVIDLCAGAGGKTLALAAMMQGKGRLIATDHDKRQPGADPRAAVARRRPQCRRAHAERRGRSTRRYQGVADLVLIDAPCTGTGTWRRNPDAKWRMRPGALEVRLKDQVAVLNRAAALVKPGGRIAYITCSVLPPENGDQVRGFVERHPEFAVVSPEQTASVLWDKSEDFANAALRSEEVG